MNLPRIPFRLFVLLMLAVPVARAQQTGTLPVNPVPTGSTLSFSLADCLASPSPTIGVTWVGEVTDTDTRAFISTSTTCDPESNVLTGFSRIGVSRADTTFTAEGVAAADVFAALAPEGEEACRPNIDDDVLFCIEVDRLGIGGLNTVFEGRLGIELDTTPPSAPTDVQVSARESALVVSWSIPDPEADEIRSFIVQARNTVTDVVTEREFNGTVREGRINGLDNDTPHEVVVFAVDKAGASVNAGNVSDASETVTGTPQEVQDFWERYHDLGGQEQGGCASASGLLLSLAGLFVLLRRRRTGALVLLLSFLATAAPARAQESSSPQRMSFELRTGPYRPNVDDESSLTGTPWADTFAEDSSWLWRVELDFDLFRAFGRLGVGVSLGYTSFDGHGRLPDGSPSEDDVYFSVLPITPLVYYRADFLDKRWGVPFVPYAKAGYGFVYWSTGVEGEQSDDPLNGKSRPGSGWARGLELSAGLQLVLDALEPDQTAELDQDFGINSTSLFFDATWVYWRGDHLLLEDTIFSGGLLLAF